MILKNRQRRVPELNTTSTADISFMLLILFLVATSMDIDKGLSRQLPPPVPPEETLIEREVDRENILDISVLPDNRIEIDGKTVGFAELKKRLYAFVEAKKDKHILRIEAAPDARYDTYFKMQNTIVDCYRTLRDNYSMARYNKKYAQLDYDDQQQVGKIYPQRISETYESTEGGRQ